jgi:hypothetical protein
MGGGRHIGNYSSPVAPGTAALEYTKYLVGPTGRYTTIQAAINAAVADGFTGADAATQAVIWIQPGSYTGNVTVPGGYFSLCGLGSIEAVINGNLTWTLAGTGTGSRANFQNIRVTGNTTFVSAAANADIIIADSHLQALTIDCTGTAHINDTRIAGTFTRTAAAGCFLANCLLQGEVACPGLFAPPVFTGCNFIGSANNFSGHSATLVACHLVMNRITLTSTVDIYGCNISLQTPVSPAITSTIINTAGSLFTTNDVPLTNGVIIGAFTITSNVNAYGPNAQPLSPFYSVGYIEKVWTVGYDPINLNYPVQFSFGHKVAITLTASGPIAIAAASLRAGAQYVLQLQQDTIGGHTVTWPTSVRWPGGLPPVLSTAPNAVDVITMVTFDGVNLLAVPNFNFL